MHLAIYNTDMLEIAGLLVRSGAIGGVG